MRFLLVFLLFVSVALMPFSTRADYPDTIYVPQDKATIQAAIDSASNGDVVKVAQGTYRGVVNFCGKAIEVLGNATLPDFTIIQPSRSDLQTDVASAVLFVSGESSTSVLNGFTIQKGKGTVSSGERRGGGIYCDSSSSPTIANNIIKDNYAAKGGGIYCDSACSPLIRDNVIRDDTAQYGGGIYCTMASPTIRDNAIRYCYSGSGGGGIQCDNSSPIIRCNTIEEDTTESNVYYGGGIVCLGYELGSGEYPTIDSNTVSDNVGGGIWCECPFATISHNTVSGNEGELQGGIGVRGASSGTVVDYNRIFDNEGAEGGGIFLCFGDKGERDLPRPRHATVVQGTTGRISLDVVIKNNIIINNVADDGGGIFCTDLAQYPATITNNTIAGNSASNGAGIYSKDDSSPLITNNVVVSNSGAGIQIDPDQYSSPVISYNDSWDNSGGNFVDCPDGVGETNWGTNFNGTPCDSFYNIIQDPSFVDAVDFELPCTSPCVDAGDPETDVNPDRGGCRVDQGAREYEYMRGDADCDSDVDWDDYCYVFCYLACGGAAPCCSHAADANCNGTVEFTDLAWYTATLSGNPPCTTCEDCP